MDLSGHEGQIPIPMPNTTYVGGVPYGQQPRRGGGGVAVIRYRECLKNHAVSLGGSATDGCGEFMPSGEEGTLEAYKCSACSCHRNFHRREVVEGAEQQLSSSSCESYQQHLKGGRRGLLLTAGPPLVMPLGVLQASSESEEKRKKRFRTKFSAEQKEKMLGFAERVGWRLQGLEEGVVQHFCQEIGVKRRVLKIWMHNNKHTLAKKNPPLLTS